MSNGWPIPCLKRWGARMLVVPALAIALVGCAQDQKRGGLFGQNGPKPLFPKAAATRPEPGLRVQAPGVDVQVSNREGKEIQIGRSSEAPEIASRMDLFRSPSSDHSVERLPPSSRSLEELPAID